MRRLLIILLAMLLTASLFGCAKQETVYTVDKNGVEFQVDTIEKTISDGKNIYKYEFSGDSSSYHAKITYPNGSSYSFSQSGYTGSGSWSGDYNETIYVPGDTLIDIIAEDAPRKGNSGMFFGKLILIALGLFELLAPEASWYISHGWKYKDAEPSEAALVFTRIGGGIVIAVAIILLFV